MLFPANEPIVVHGAAGAVDDDGFPVAGAPDVTVRAVSVQPLSLEEIQALDRDGVVDALRLWLPAGTDVHPGDEVTVRGLRYRVEQTPWDWSVRRRPALSLHRPSVVVDCVRGVG